MAEPLRRTQILLRKDQHEALAERAEHEGTSLSELLRSLVDEGLRRANAEKKALLARKLERLRGIRSRHDEILKRRGGRPIDVDPTALIRGIREERDGELFGHLTRGA